MLLKTTWSNWKNNARQLLNVLRNMQGNYISTLDTLPDTIMIRILTSYLCTSPKLPQSVAMPIANPHFFVYPPERGEIGQSLPRLAHFHLKTSLNRWQLIKWCFTSSLHPDSRTKPIKPHDEPKFFSIFAIQKAVLRHNERLTNERLLPVLLIVSNAIQV